LPDRRHLVIVVACLGLLVHAAHGGAWYEGQIRGLYGPQNESTLAKEGFNLVYRNRVFHRDDYISDFKGLSLEAEEHGLTFIAGLYYLAGEVDFPYSRAVVSYGYTDEFRPSPVDPIYWQKVIHETAIAVAEASLDSPIDGLVYDFELYLAGGSGFNYGREDQIFSYSFDPPAVSSFAGDRGLEAPDLEPNQTYSWLEGEALVAEFMNWQRNQVREMAAATAEAVRAINPDLSLGILGFQNCWHHWTILEAWNWDGVPLTLWDEKSYWGFDPEFTQFRVQQIEERGLNCRYLPGLYSGAQTPKQIVGNMSRALSFHNAFWVFQYHHDTEGLGSLDDYDRAYRRFSSLGGIWRTLIGAVATVLILAGTALGAVAIRNRLQSRGGRPPAPFSCNGEPELGKCRTCRFLQSYGDDYLCTKIGQRIASEDLEEEEKGSERPE
jgi:hypothetical protein